MKTLILLLALLNITNAQAGERMGQDGRGGGGVNQNGHVMTFYSAGVRVTTEKAANEIPGLSSLVQVLQGRGLFNYGIAGRLISSVLPNANRSYYDINPATFDVDTKNRILAEYARVTGQPEQGLVVFAVTDTEKGQTFLFPDFYRLTETEQMTVLFHEGQWALNPESKYQDIIRKEITFQKYLQVSSPDNAMNFVSMIDSNSALALALRLDTQSGTLVTTVNSKGSKSEIVSGADRMVLTARNLFGANYFPTYYPNRTNNNVLVPQATALVQRFPSSQFLKLWLKQTLSDDVQVGVCYYDDIYMNITSEYYVFPPALMDLPFKIDINADINELVTSEIQKNKLTPLHVALRL